MSDTLGAVKCGDGSGEVVQLLPIQHISIYRHKGTLSDRGEVTCGVPQGSILGPLLFLIYVMDMESAVDCDPLFYAEDSDLLIRGKNVINIKKKLSKELTN